jgi:hypothetical protein
MTCEMGESSIKGLIADDPCVPEHSGKNNYYMNSSDFMFRRHASWFPRSPLLRDYILRQFMAGGRLNRYRFFFVRVENAPPDRPFPAVPTGG